MERLNTQHSATQHGSITSHAHHLYTQNSDSNVFI